MARCPFCRQTYDRKRMNQKCCESVECAISAGQARKAKEAAKQAKAERRDIKARKEKIKTRGEWTAEAQQAVNALRRNEELAKGRGCMSCGRTQAEVQSTDGWKPGGAWDAGHFVSVGANPTLRFEPKNIWLQCKSCNAGSGKYARKAATVSAAYEINLREQEGDELVDWLKGPHEPNNHTSADLKAIRDTYRAKLKELKHEQLI